jgi:hypothetical protein
LALGQTKLGLSVNLRLAGWLRQHSPYLKAQLVEAWNVHSLCVGGSPSGDSFLERRENLIFSLRIYKDTGCSFFFPQ